MITINELFDKYLAWCGNHRAPRSLEWYSGHIKGFRTHLGQNADNQADTLKPFHVIEWTDAHPKWGSTYKRGAIVAIQRAFNWAEEMGYISITPIKRIKKPTAKRREIYMTPDDFTQLLGLISEADPFRDLFLFVWHSGCRPQEVRHIEPRHVELENERIVFPAEESKGKRSKRVIYLHGVTLEIITRLLQKYSEGKLFRNKRGTAWSKYAVCNRYFRLSKITGKRMFCYASRHGFGTRKLVQGHDPISIAAIMGHTDGSMLAKIYSHMDKEVDHLKKALEE